MATATAISVSEYLKTSYSPDCEYIDGEVQERNLGEYEHARLQGLLVLLFGIREEEWDVMVLPEQRIQVSATRFRVPDVCVLRRSQQIEPIFTAPPFICIEILSPEDTLRRLQDRVEDYLRFGVENIWVIDPSRRQAYVCNATGLHVAEGGELRVAGTPIEVKLAEVFARL